MIQALLKARNSFSMGRRTGHLEADPDFQGKLKFVHNLNRSCSLLTTEYLQVISSSTHEVCSLFLVAIVFLAFDLLWIMVVTPLDIAIIRGMTAKFCDTVLLK